MNRDACFPPGCPVSSTEPRIRQCAHWWLSGDLRDPRGSAAGAHIAIGPPPRGLRALTLAAVAGSTYQPRLPANIHRHLFGPVYLALQVGPYGGSWRQAAPRLTPRDPCLRTDELDPRPAALGHRLCLRIHPRPRRLIPLDRLRPQIARNGPAHIHRACERHVCSLTRHL